MLGKTYYLWFSLTPFSMEWLPSVITMHGTTQFWTFLLIQHYSILEKIFKQIRFWPTCWEPQEILRSLQVSAKHVQLKYGAQKWVRRLSTMVVDTNGVMLFRIDTNANPFALVSVLNVFRYFNLVKYRIITGLNCNIFGSTQKMVDMDRMRSQWFNATITRTQCWGR